MGTPSIKNRLSDKDLLRKQLLSTATVDLFTVDTAKEYISTLGDKSIASLVLSK